MKKRVLSMLLALVMALSLAVPAFAADEFEAEVPAVQEEEAPAAPVAEESEEPEAPAEVPDVPAAAAVEPEAVDDEPAAAAENGKLTIKGDTTQIYAVSMFDLDWNYAGDPREVGVVPGGEIDVWLKPGYAVEGAVVNTFSWYAGEEDIPAADEDVVPAAVSVVMAPEEGGDMTITIVEGGPALPETIPVTYKNDKARFGCSLLAYKDSSRLNWVTFRPGYIVKIDGGTLDYVSPYIDGSALEAGYFVDEGAEKVTIDFIKSTGKLIIEDPEDALFKADLFDDPDEKTWWNTATWMGDVLLVNDFCPGMGINIEMSADYMLEGLDEALVMSTGVYLQDNPESDYCDELVRFYHIKTPDTDGNIELTVKQAQKVTVKYVGDTEGIVEKDETSFPGAEFTFTLKRGYYASFENAGFNWAGVIPAEELFVNHCGVDREAESVTVTIHKTDAVLRFTKGNEFMWGVGMNDENGQYTSPIGGMKPGAHVYISLDGSASLEFVGGEPEDLNDRYETVTDSWDEHNGELRHWYDFTAPDHDLEIHAVEGKAPDPITVDFVDPFDAIHYDDDQAYPGGNLPLHVKPGYYLETTNSDTWCDGEKDDKGSYMFSLNVWPDAESVTVTAGEATGKLVIAGQTSALCGTGMDNNEENVCLSDPTLGLAPGANVCVTVANGYAVEFAGAARLGYSYPHIDNDPNSDFFGKPVFDYVCTAPEKGDVTATIVSGETVDYVPVKIVDPENGLRWADCEGGALLDQPYMVALKDGFSLSLTNGEIVDNWVDVEEGVITVYYGVQADGKGTMTLTVAGGAEKHTMVPIHYVDEDDAILSKDYYQYAIVGTTIPVWLEDGYVAKVEGADYSPYSDEIYVPAGTKEVTVTAMAIVPNVQLTIQGETAAVIPNDAQDVKDEIDMTGYYDELLVSDGDVLEDGMGNILVKDGYTVTAVSGAVVTPYFCWFNDDNTVLYNDYLVAATDDHPVVKVEKGRGYAWFITATVNNEDGADFQFDNTNATLQEDGTYKLYTFGELYMVVEDGYELDVDGATYFDTALDEETGDIVRVYTLDEDAESVTVTVTPAKSDIPAAPKSGTGWVQNDAGDIYFYQKGELKKGFWVGKVDGASKWDNTWYYVGDDGKLATGMQYIDDLHGGYGWYYLQPTNANGQIGKMLTGWQWVGVQDGVNYGTCYFSSKSGSSGKCTYSSELGDWNGATWTK